MKEFAPRAQIMAAFWLPLRSRASASADRLPSPIGSRGTGRVAGSNDRRYNARDLGDAGGRRIGRRHVGNDRPDAQVRRFRRRDNQEALAQRRTHRSVYRIFDQAALLSENGSLAAATKNPARSIRRVFAPRTSALLMLTCDSSEPIGRCQIVVGS